MEREVKSSFDPRVEERYEAMPKVLQDEVDKVVRRIKSPLRDRLRFGADADVPVRHLPSPTGKLADLFIQELHKRLKAENIFRDGFELELYMRERERGSMSGMTTIVGPVSLRIHPLKRACTKR